MDIQLKQQLKNTLLQNIDSLMREYNIPASSMEDALESILAKIKDLVMQEYIQENMIKVNELEHQIEDLQNPKEENEDV